MDVDKKSKIIACIPAFNEEKTIASVVVQARKYVDRVVVCDDGSVDLTGEIAEALGAVVVRHEENMGYGAAIISLFKEARRLCADIAVTLDGDGQHDPRQIPRLVEPLVRNEADIVIGSRFLRREDSSKVPRYRAVGLKMITGLTSNASYDNLTDAQSGFRAYSCRSLEVLMVTEQGMGVSTEILLKANERGLRVVEVPVTISYRKDS
ncbi:MAG: glycosyltransferase family 2 protein, partial [Candidatus Bathyarchaeia archaeon]